MPEAAAPPPAPEAVAAAAPPPPAAAPGLAWPFALPGFAPAAAPRLTLSNFTYDRAHVEAAVTTTPDCAAGAAPPVEFDLAYNGTRVITPPTGSDVCWRRDVSEGAGAGPQWSRWNRAYLSSGQSVDSRL